MKSLAFLWTLLLLLSPVMVLAQEEEDTATERTYELYVPESYEEGTALPLLFVLHGAGGEGLWMEQITGFNDLAEEHGFIVVYPDGLHNNWDFGGGIMTPEGEVIASDDVGYLTGLIDTLAEDYSIDRGRVFATGFSNGGSMAYTLACEAPETFAAVASVAAPLSVYIAGGCSEMPISVMIIHGTDDPILQWESTYAQDGRLIAFSAIETVTWWAEHNGCDPDAIDFTEIEDADPTDGSTVRLLKMVECEAETEAVIYGIYGGGHTWAGHPFPTAFDIGATNMDIDASQAIWEWFASLPSREVVE